MPEYGPTSRLSCRTVTPGLNATGPNQSNEIDLYGGIYYTVAPGVAVDLGNTYYWYPEAGGSSVPTAFGGPIDRSDETYIGFTFDSTQVLGGYNFSPSIYYYHDWYLDSNVAEVSAKYTWDVSKVLGFTGVTVVPRVYAGWDESKQAFGDQIFIGGASPRPNWANSYCYWGATLDLNYKLNDYVTIFGEASYAGNNDGTGKNPAGFSVQNGGTPNSVWVGGGVSSPNNLLDSELSLRSFPSRARPDFGAGAGVLCFHAKDS